MENTFKDDFFRKVLDNAAVAGFDGYFREISTSWQRSLGWPKETLLSRPIEEFVHPDDRAGLLEYRAQLHSGEFVEGLQNRYLCADGSYRWFEWRATADIDRRLVFAVARDITEQKARELEFEESQRNEQDLRKRLVVADRMATVGTLAAGMAHEINNPLASLMSNISLMHESIDALRAEQPSKLVEDFAEMLEESLESTRRISKLIGGLRRFSVSSPGEIEQLEIGPLVQRVVAMVGPEIRHLAELVEDYGLTAPIEADAAELSQVILNLVINASQAIGPGGPENNRISLKTYSEPHRWVVFEVSDTGRGIPNHLKERVLEPFFTTKSVDPGTGLGLSISHAIVERIGGRLELESEEGVGSCVRILLPALDDTEVVG